MSSSMADPDESDRPPLLTSSGLPASLPAALYDIVARHDRLASVSPAAARAFLAHCLDKRRAGPLDLGELASFLLDKGADVSAAHEVVLSVAALAPALKERVSLPSTTAALAPKDRALLLAGFVARCPPKKPLPGVLAKAPVVDDYLSSVVTGKWRRRQRRRVALGVLLATACAAGLGFAAWSFLEADPAPAVPAPLPSAAPGDKQARAQARFEAAAAERYLQGGDVEKALASARKAVELDEGYAQARRALAVAAMRAGHAQEACRNMRAYVERAATAEPAKSRLVASACDDMR